MFYLRSSIEFRFFVHNILFDYFFLLITKTKMVHLLFQHLPSVFALILLTNALGVFPLNVLLSKLSSFFHPFSDLSRSLNDLVLVLRGDLSGSGRTCEQVVSLNFELGHYLN